MNFHLPFSPPRLSHSIQYTDKVLLLGSCFTEHIAKKLEMHRFRVLQNPHGILFNPLSVADSLLSYSEGRQYTIDDLFLLNETWNSWAHHSRFSDVDRESALAGINEAQAAASAFIKEADCIIITLGSAFQYYLIEGGRPVANNHRAPAAWFEKKLLGTDEIVAALKGSIEKIFTANPKVQVLFTISPVRHIRDGVVENNRSKARLIEAVHMLCDWSKSCHYFPAYEIVIDVLRDYRFYDVDLVHPNYAATEAVWEYFIASCIAPEALPIMERVKDIMIAKGHRPRFPETEGHQKFLDSYADKVKALMRDAPWLTLEEELNFFYHPDIKNAQERQA